MEIDLSETTQRLGFVETTYESMRLKSNKLVKEIQYHKISENLDHNFMIIPMSIFNIIECNQHFKHSHINAAMDLGILYVGDLLGFKCYLDITQPSDTITLSYDKSIMRDNKIESILNNEKIKEEIDITVLNY
jgi:hypothetical protein